MKVLCWGETSRWNVVLVLVLVLDTFGRGFHKLYFSITRATTRTRNNLLGISGI